MALGKETSVLVTLRNQSPWVSGLELELELVEKDGVEAVGGGFSRCVSFGANRLSEQKGQLGCDCRQQEESQEME